MIGTNRHASLRIDQQLRGRAGRQGDPGSSRFFVSLEDPLIRRYGVEQLVSARHLPEPPGRAASSPACCAPRSRAPSGSSRTRASSCGARSSATPRSSRSSAGPSSAGAGRCWSGSEAAAPPRRARGRALRSACCPSSARTVLDEVERRLTPPRDRPLLERPPRGAAGDARGQRAAGLRRPLPARRVPPPGGGELPGARGPDRGRGRPGLRADRDHAPGRRLGAGGPARSLRHVDLPGGREPLRRERPPLARGPDGHGVAAAFVPWLVLLQGLSVFWKRRRRPPSLPGSSGIQGAPPEREP